MYKYKILVKIKQLDEFQKLKKVPEWSPILKTIMMSTIKKKLRKDLIVALNEKRKQIILRVL